MFCFIKNYVISIRRAVLNYYRHFCLNFCDYDAVTRKSINFYTPCIYEIYQNILMFSSKFVPLINIDATNKIMA